MIDKATLKRLYLAIDYARRELGPFRESATRLLEEFVGAHYPTGAADVDDKPPTPVNMLNFAMMVHARTLAAKTPQAYITSTVRHLDTPAKQLEIALNHVSKRIKLGKTLNAAVMNALVGLGVVKVGVSTYATDELEGFSPVSGCPFAEVVDLDDLVFDVSARKWADIGFIGNRYRLPFEEVKNSPIYDKKALANLKPTRRTTLNEEGDERLEGMTRSYNLDADEFEDHVELIDVFLPARRGGKKSGRPAMLLTIPAEHKNAEIPPLREIEWEGPPCGPYHLLSFCDVPGQLIPLAPANVWLDLHLLINATWNKVGDQATREKTIGIAALDQTDDAQKIVDADDGVVIPARNPNAVSEMHFGGVNSNTLAFAIQSGQIFKDMNGALDSLAGTGPQADTLGQEQLLSAAANKMIAGMQDVTTEFAAAVMKSIAWYILTDPLIKLPLEIEHSGIVIPFEYTPENQMGELIDYQITIEPYSLQHVPPFAKLQSVFNLLNMLAPFMQQMQQQGISLDYAELVELCSRLSNVDELARVVRTQTPPMPQDAENDPTSPTKSPVSTRNYVRRNVAGASPRSQAESMVSQLLGSAQKAQTARAMRPTG